MLEGEGLERQRERRAREIDELQNPAAKNVGENPRRVEDVSHDGRLAENVALALDRLLQRRFAPVFTQAGRERMAAPRFGESLHEFRGRSRQKEDAHVVPFGAQGFNAVADAFEGGVGTGVDGDRRHVRAARMQVAQDGDEKVRGQIVDAVVAAVFELSDGDRLAASREAGNQNDLHARSMRVVTFAQSTAKRNLR